MVNFSFLPIRSSDKTRNWQSPNAVDSVSRLTWYIKYAVPSISFPTFFVQAFKTVVDSWKFSMLLLYILWDNWPILYDFRFKWIATAGIGIHLTKAWFLQLVNFKNAIWTLEERYAIKFCFKLGKMPWNESWIYCYDPEAKRQSSQWKHIGSPRPKKAKQSKSTRKLLMIPFFDSTRMIYMHWVPTAQTVNKEYYVEVLREFRKRFRRKRPALFKSGPWHFYQDNAPVHNSTLFTDY